MKRDIRVKNPRLQKTGAVIIGGNFQGLGVLRSLARQKVPIYLLDQGWCIGQFSRYTGRFARCPGVREQAHFLDFLMEMAAREDLNGWLLYPNDDETVCFLAQHKAELEKHYRVTTPDWEIVRFAYDKRLTYGLAQKCGIPIPRTYYPATVRDLEQIEISFPAILKPSIKEPFYSRTRKKAIRVNSRQELLAEFSRAVPAIDSSTQVLMVQELIPGAPRNLFSVGSLFNGKELLAKVVARRPRQHPMDFGHATTYAETVYVPVLEQMASRILAAMGYRGLSEVEFMLDPRDGQYKLIEINARPWGWHTLAIAAGVDLPYLSYRERLGEDARGNGFKPGVKWMRLVTDLPTVAIEMAKGRMKLSDYLSSLKGTKQDAVFSLGDPLPFFAELALLPYLWKKRGF